MAVSPASGTTAVTTTTIKTSRQRSIKTRATELTGILYVTKEGVYPREAVFTVIREPKSDSTLNKGAYMGK
jgi:mannose/fructose/N-acetylgalactosamine-specific phosphotransferase system component IIB